MTTADQQYLRSLLAAHPEVTTRRDLIELIWDDQELTGRFGGAIKDNALAAVKELTDDEVIEMASFTGVTHE